MEDNTVHKDPTKEKTLTVLIVTPDNVLYEGQADSIIAPGKNDIPIGILPFHTPFYTKLYKGDIIVELQKDQKKFPIESGVARVINNSVIILVGF